jgi:hypothetical protein
MPWMRLSEGSRAMMVRTSRFAATIRWPDHGNLLPGRRHVDRDDGAAEGSGCGGGGRSGMGRQKASACHSPQQRSSPMGGSLLLACTHTDGGWRRLGFVSGVDRSLCAMCCSNEGIGAQPVPAHNPTVDPRQTVSRTFRLGAFSHRGARAPWEAGLGCGWERPS